jgi:uncharacterized protein
MNGTTKPLVIYHDNCTDGFASAFCAWLKFGEDAEYFPCNYNSFIVGLDGSLKYKTEVTGLKDRVVYIVDFSFPRMTLEMMGRYAAHITVLDHHKTAQAELMVKTEIEGVWTVSGRRGSNLRL